MASGQNTAVEVFEFNKDDPIQGTRLVKRPVPEPGEGQVLVNILLRPINPSDVMSLIGVYPGFTTKLPGVPGIDGACALSMSTCLNKCPLLGCPADDR